VALRHPLFAVLVGAVLVFFAGCDSSGPEPALEPAFDMSVGAPVGASVKGKAALGSNLSFEEQGVFTFPVPAFDKTASIVQLSGETERGVAHDLSFLRLADEGLSEGTYELKRPCEDGCGFGAFPPDELFAADYSRQTTDSLYSYPIRSGTVTVETADDEGVQGRFSLTSTFEVSVARADLEAFIDSLRRPRDTTSVPPRPPTNLQVLEQPLTIEGTFTATSGEALSDRVPHLGGLGLGVDRDTLVLGP
jgi:hypothetical protein